MNIIVPDAFRRVADSSPFLTKIAEGAVPLCSADAPASLNKSGGLSAWAPLLGAAAPEVLTTTYLGARWAQSALNKWSRRDGEEWGALLELDTLLRGAVGRLRSLKPPTAKAPSTTQSKKVAPRALPPPAIALRVKTCVIALAALPTTPRVEAAPTLPAEDLDRVREVLSDTAALQAAPSNGSQHWDLFADGTVLVVGCVGPAASLGHAALAFKFSDDFGVFSTIGQYRSLVPQLDQSRFPDAALDVKRIITLLKVVETISTVQRVLNQLRADGVSRHCSAELDALVWGFHATGVPTTECERNDGRARVEATMAAPGWREPDAAEREDVMLQCYCRLVGFGSDQERVLDKPLSTLIQRLARLLTAAVNRGSDLRCAVDLARRYGVQRMCGVIVVTWIGEAVLRRLSWSALLGGRNGSIAQHIAALANTRASTSAAQVLLRTSATAAALNAVQRVTSVQMENSQRVAGTRLVCEALFSAITSDDAKEAAAKLRAAVAVGSDLDIAGAFGAFMRGCRFTFNCICELLDAVAFGARAPGSFTAMLGGHLARQMLVARLRSALEFQELVSAARIESSELLDANVQRAAIIAGRPLPPHCGRLALRAVADRIGREDPAVYGQLCDGSCRVCKVPEPTFGLAALLATVDPRTRGACTAFAQLAAFTMWPSTPADIAPLCWTAPQKLWVDAVRRGEAAGALTARDTFVATCALREAEAERDLSQRVTQRNAELKHSAADMVQRMHARESTAALRRMATSFIKGSAQNPRADMSLRELLKNEPQFDELRLQGSDVTMTTAIIAVAEAQRSEQGSQNTMADEATEKLDEKARTALFAQSRRRIQSVTGYVSACAIHAAAVDKVEVDHLAQRAVRVGAWIERNATDNHADFKISRAIKGLATFRDHETYSEGHLLGTAKQFTAFERLPHTIDRVALRGKPLPWEWLDSVAARRGHHNFSITFDNVSFTHAPLAVPIVYAVNGVSFHIAAGKMCAIVGESGSGKSTLIAMLLRIYQPTAGRILVEDIDIRDLPPRWLRRRFAYVGQAAPMLKSLSVRDNMTIAAPLASTLDMEEALRHAQASVIFHQPHEWKDPIDRRAFSGGEQQRLSIAQATVRRLLGASLVILDEATSALDVETERAVQRTAFDVASTRVVVAHRLSTVRTADTIVVLKNGEVIEHGTWDELVQIPDGQFRKLVDLQNVAAKPSTSTSAPSPAAATTESGPTASDTAECHAAVRVETPTVDVKALLDELATLCTSNPAACASVDRLRAAVAVKRPTTVEPA